MFNLGKRAISVNVSPKRMLMIEGALTAHPFAFKSGAIFLRLSFIQAMTMDGPEIISMIEINRITICHHFNTMKSLKMLDRAVPIIPKAIPKAAKIPANFPISNGAGAAAAGSLPIFAGAVLIFSVASFRIFASFSAALLLTKSSITFAIFL